MYHDTDRQVHLYHSTQGLPRLGLHPKKIELVFPFLSKERRDNMRSLCLDHTNNLFSFIYIFCTYTKAKGLTTQATTITPPCRQEGYGQPRKEQTPLVAAASIRPSSSSTVVDIDAAKEDGPSTLPSTKSQTRAAEIYRASSSASASCRSASSTLSCPAASSR
jgi:hypothetical protein